ncbi:hypothetical protein C8F01DRAFT_1286471, partial [Mycena amicta]
RSRPSRSRNPPSRFFENGGSPAHSNRTCGPRDRFVQLLVLTSGTVNVSQLRVGSEFKDDLTVAGSSRQEGLDRRVQAETHCLPESPPLLSETYNSPVALPVHIKGLLIPSSKSQENSLPDSRFDRPTPTLTRYCILYSALSMLPTPLPSTPLAAHECTRLVRSSRKVEALLGEAVTPQLQVSPRRSSLARSSSSVTGQRQKRRPVLLVRLPQASDSTGMGSPTSINIPSPTFEQPLRQRSLAKLARTFGENVPPELVPARHTQAQSGPVRRPLTRRASSLSVYDSYRSLRRRSSIDVAADASFLMLDSPAESDTAASVHSMDTPSPSESRSSGSGSGTFLPSTPSSIQMPVHKPRMGAVIRGLRGLRF